MVGLLLLLQSGFFDHGIGRLLIVLTLLVLSFLSTEEMFRRGNCVRDCKIPRFFIMGRWRNESRRIIEGWWGGEMIGSSYFESFCFCGNALLAQEWEFPPCGCVL